MLGDRLVGRVLVGEFLDSGVEAVGGIDVGGIVCVECTVDELDTHFR